MIELIMLKTKTPDKGFCLVPVYGEEIEKDIWYVNLTNEDNKDLLKGVKISENYPCFIIDGKTGIVLLQGSGKKELKKVWFSSGQKKLEEFKKTKAKTYAKLCADYTARLIEFNETVEVIDE